MTNCTKGGIIALLSFPILICSSENLSLTALTITLGLAVLITGAIIHNMPDKPKEIAPCRTAISTRRSEKIV